MVQSKYSAASLDNNYQEKYRPLYWGGIRVRHWFRRGLMPLMSIGMLGMIGKEINPTISFSPFSGKNPTYDKVAKIDAVSSLRFNRDYHYGEYTALNGLAKDGVTEEEAVKKLETVYDIKALTNEEIYAKRADHTSQYYIAAHDSAEAMLKNDLDIGELVPRFHQPTSGYGWRTVFGVRQNHHGKDLKFYDGEPISSTKELTYLDAGMSNNGTINYVRVMDGKARITVRHDEELSIDNEFGLKRFEEGDKIPAGIPFAINDGKVGKKYRTTGTNAHIEVHVQNKKGHWIEVNPTKYAKQFQSAEGFTQTRHNLDPMVADYLAKDGFYLEKLGEAIDDMQPHGKTSAQRKKSLGYIHSLKTTYQGYVHGIDRRTDSIIRAGIDEDVALVAAAFNGSYKPSAIVEDNNAKKPSAVLQASIFGNVAVDFSTKKEDMTVKAAATDIKTEKATTEKIVTSSHAWTSRYKTLSQREESLRNSMLAQGLSDRIARETGVDKEEIVDDLIGVVRDHEDNTLNPSVRSSTSSATSFGQHTIGNQKTLKKSYNLPKFDASNTQHGVDVQSQYLLAGYGYNFKESGKEDAKFASKSKNHGRTLLNTSYVRTDNGEVVYMDQRRAATTGWGGIYGLMKNLSQAQNEADKKHMPYAKLNLWMCGQDFNNYADIAQVEEHDKLEAKAAEEIHNDSRLAAYYAPKHKSSSKKNDAVVTTVGNVNYHFVANKKDITPDLTPKEDSIATVWHKAIQNSNTPTKLADSISTSTLAPKFQQN